MPPCKARQHRGHPGASEQQQWWLPAGAERRTVSAEWHPSFDSPDPSDVMHSRVGADMGQYGTVACTAYEARQRFLLTTDQVDLPANQPM